MAKKSLPTRVVSFSGLQSAYVKAYPPVVSLSTLAAGKKIVDKRPDEEEENNVEGCKSLLSFSNKDKDVWMGCNGWCLLWRAWIRGSV